MHDDDDALAGIDLAAWQPPMPPVGTADAVIARMREPVAMPAAVAAVDPHDRPSRRAWWLSGLGLAATAAVALVTWGVTRAPLEGHDEVIAALPRHLELDGSTADLDAGAQVRWDRDRHRITATQARGSVRWTIADDDTLVIDSGGSPSAATIEASGASLRVEVQMNLSDMRLLGATTITAAAVAVVTVVVYAGHVKATSGGQTVNVEPGATVELRAAHPPRPPQVPSEPVAVGASPADVQLLKEQLRAADKKIAELTAQLAARTVDLPPVAKHESPPPPADPCGTSFIEDAMEQAANQYSAGYAKAALALTTKILACKQDVRLYRLVTLYACAAHDLATAKQMFAKVPPALQASLEQRCQLEGFNLREP